MDDAKAAICKFNCMRCQTPIMARIPSMRIYNFPEMSGCIMSHERQTKCPQCQTSYVPIIQSVSGGGQLQFGWREVSLGQVMDPRTTNNLTGNMAMQATRKQEKKENEDNGNSESGKIGSAVQGTSAKYL